MVKNTTGGSKTKGQARKFATGPSKNTLRISNNELELYAFVTKMNGNGMCNVLCIDGTTRLCQIRGKFRGRGKRDNLVSFGSWLLVGLREWTISSKKSDKMEQCDLLEVYNETEVQRLKDTINDVNWSVFTVSTSGTDDHHANIVEFEDDKTTEYHTLIEQQLANMENNKSIAIPEEDEEEIDVNDI
jgi:initiation factor 1A